jgi:HNH endonuclease
VSELRDAGGRFRRSVPYPQRFWAQVDRAGRAAGECWPWAGRCDRYGIFTVGKRAVLAHRYAWTLATAGPVPDGLCVLHECDNPPCCNPAHLFLGTQLQNIEDRQRKGRQARGERINATKLTPEQVREIRERYAAGERQIPLAKEYGINHGTVSRIVNREFWEHVQ